jgi:hypothetical protein
VESIENAKQANAGKIWRTEALLILTQAMVRLANYPPNAATKRPAPRLALCI